MESKGQICSEKINKDKEIMIKIREENLKLYSEPPGNHHQKYLKI